MGCKQGIGFITGGRVETPRGFLIALDYDNCRNPKTGRISPWASNAMRKFANSFTEVSPSGFGLRQWLLVERLPDSRTRAVIPVAEDMVPGCSKKVEVQLFGLNAHGGGYVTVTGDHLDGTSREILRIPKVDAVFEQFDYPMDYAAAGEELVVLPDGEGDDPPDTKTIGALVRMQPKGEELIAGEWEKTNHPSASEAFFELEQRVLVAANGHGDATLDFLLDCTAWGHGDIENSKDPGKYEREDWVSTELLRTCGKTYLSGTAEAFDGLDHDAADEAIDASRRAATEAITSEQRKQAAKSPIAQIRSPEFTSIDTPAPREYLLSHPSGVGLLPRGKVGLLSAAGGTGKTTALVQLAIAVATRRRWFEHYRIGESCGARVMFLMGEEDADEVQRKMFYTCNAMGLTPVERATVAKRVECIPLAGHALPFLQATREGAVQPTPHSEALMQRLNVGDDWGLVIVDPISRFCGTNVEGDNILATRFVQELERFAKAPGLPTVLGVGHTSKAARAQGSAEQRGVTGLIDAVRWGASMLTRDDGRVVFEIQKNNLAPPTTDPLMLVRGDEGHLQAEDATQRRTREREQQERATSADIARASRDAEARDSRVDSRVAAVVAAVEKHPGKTGNELVSLVSGRRSDVLDAIRRADAAGSIEASASGRRREFHRVSLLD